jgi:hypothetical protein
MSDTLKGSYLNRISVTAVDVLPRECLQQDSAMDHAAFARPSQKKSMLPSTSNDGCMELDRALHLNPAPQPFARQNGNQLLLLDSEDSCWLVAELVFDPELCIYVEIRRAVYQQQREAIGALLSRALASGDNALIDTVEHLDSYMTEHYQVSLINA